MKQRFLTAIQEAIRSEMARAVSDVAPSLDGLPPDDLDSLVETTAAASALFRLARSL